MIAMSGIHGIHAEARFAAQPGTIAFSEMMQTRNHNADSRDQQGAATSSNPGETTVFPKMP
jgi:hypothetical protein